ncbi:hypothetical protein ACOSP7_027600 [Xanthoceras sorbifolium]
METSHQQPLSIESFSYSWLVNLKPSLEGLLDSSDYEANSFIEMDPTMPPSKRFLRRNYSQDFKFDFPISQQSPLALVHADELFANGYVMPHFVDHPLIKMEAFEASSSDSSSLAAAAGKAAATASTTTSSHVAKVVMVGGPSGGSSGRKLTRSCSSLRKCRKLSKRLFQKYLDFLVRPLYRRIRGGGGGGRSSSRAHDHHHQNGDSRVHHVANTWVYSAAETSPRISVAYSSTSVDDDYWRKSCDSESSIYEAVLHCKRSIGN